MEILTTKRKRVLKRMGLEKINIFIQGALTSSSIQMIISLKVNGGEIKIKERQMVEANIITIKVRMEMEITTNKAIKTNKTDIKVDLKNSIIIKLESMKEIKNFLFMGKN